MADGSARARRRRLPLALHAARKLSDLTSGHPGNVDELRDGAWLEHVEGRPKRHRACDEWHNQRRAFTDDDANRVRFHAVRISSHVLKSITLYSFSANETDRISDYTTPFSRFISHIYHLPRVPSASGELRTRSHHHTRVPQTHAYK